MRISDWSSDVCSSDLLDPMYPHRDKQALPQQEMQILRELTGSDPDANTLLRPALAIARRRVVVKRPSHAPFLVGHEPPVPLTGKQARHHAYMPAPLATPCTHLLVDIPLTQPQNNRKNTA